MVLGILGYLVFTCHWHWGTSQDGTGYPGILSIQGLGCYGGPAIRGHPRMVLGILGYLVFTCHWGTSQDGTGYPAAGILSIQGLGCSGRPAIRGHPRMVMGILGYLVFTCHWGTSLGILQLGYLVFKDWDARAGQPSGNIPGWYWVSWDT